jgi:hypothetical protein
VATLHYRIVEAEGERGPWKVQGAGYDYAIRLDAVEMVAFHWHPAPHNPITWPHLHVGTAVLSANSPLTRKTHLPTRRIALEQVLRLAVELGADPQADDWEDVLSGSQERFECWQTWA